MNRRNALATLGLMLLASHARGADSLDRDGEVLVRLKGPAGGPSLSDVARDHASDVLGTDKSGWTRLRARAGEKLPERLRADPRVASVEPNYTTRATAAIDAAARTWTPDDPMLTVQWNLASMPAAWYATRGQASVVVAVLDTGLRADGSEAPLLTRPGRDFVNGDLDPHDDHGHGTHIASIIAQATDNASGAAGMAPDVSLLPVKVLDATGHGSLADLAQALYWATDAGATVINLSVSLPPCVIWSEALHDAVAYAAGRGVVLVAAAGNDQAASVSLPAAFNEVIAVGALHSGGERAAYSNTGMALDLVAPGGDEADRDLDTRPDAIAALAFDPVTNVAGLYLGAGTSQAAAHVSAAAALLASLGETDRDRIRSLLELTVRPVGTSPGWTPTSGYGALDVAAAIAARGSLGTVAEQGLAGFVGGQAPAPGVEPGTGLADPVAVVAAHEGAFLLVLADGSSVWALADQGADVALYRLHGPTLRSALGGPPEKLLPRIERAGSIAAWLERAGRYEGRVATTGGLAGMLGGSGGFLGILEGSGLLLVIEGPRPAGGLLALLEGAGGAMGLLDAAGGVLGVLDAAGGFLGLVGSSGGMLGIVGSSGGLVGLVGSALETHVLGTPSGLLAAE